MAWDTEVTAHVHKLLAANYNDLVSYIKAHKAQHENGGADELSVAGLSGLLADGQNPLAHKTIHENGGTDEISVAGLSGVLADNQPAAAHKTIHQNGGTDEISVAGLSGQLADNQPPLAHAANHNYGGIDEVLIRQAQVVDLATSLAGKEASIGAKGTAFNKNYGTTATDVKMNGPQAVGSIDAVARIDHVHPSDTTRATAAGTNGQTAEFNGTASLVGANKNTAFNRAFETAPTNIKMDGVQAVGSSDTIPRADHVHPSDTSRLATSTNITAINGTGIANGEIAVFNLTNKDIRTSDVTIATTLGATDATVPTSKAVKDVTDLKANIANPTFTGTPAAPTAAANTNTTQIATTAFVSTATRELLTAARTYYVRTNGNDANTGLVNDASGAFLTIQRAMTVICAELDTAGYAITIQVGDGSYAGGLVLSVPWTGGSQITLTGNASNPENVIITADTGLACTATLPAIFTIQNLSLIPSGAGGSLISNTGTGTIAYSNIRFGATAGRHILSGAVGSVVQCNGNYSIVGSAYSHFAATTGGSIICSSKTITISGTPAFSATFAESSHLGIMYIYHNTYTGSATGARYNVTTNSDVFSDATLPGNSAGSVATGGLYA